MPRVQGAELLDDEEQEDDHRPSRVQEVLQPLPQAHGAQGNQVSRAPDVAHHRGVSSTVKLSVSKTELGGSNPSAPAILLPGTAGKPRAGSEQEIEQPGGCTDSSR